MMEVLQKSPANMCLKNVSAIIWAKILEMLYSVKNYSTKLKQEIFDMSTTFWKHFQMSTSQYNHASNLVCLGKVDGTIVQYITGVVYICRF